VNPLVRTGNNLRSLEALGIVSIESLAEQNPRRFHVADLDPAPRFGPNRKPVGMALHKFIQDRHASGNPDFTFDECFAHVNSRFSGKKETMDPAAVRKQLMLMLSHTRWVGNGTAYQYWPGAERRETFNNGFNTKVTLNETYRLAVSHLMEIVADVRDRDAVALHYGRRLAGEIAADTAQKHKLIKKAYSFSNHAHQQTTAVAIAAVRGVLAGRGPSDAQTVRQALVDADGRPRTITTVKKMLNKAADKGAVAIVQAPAGASRRSRRQYYQLAAA
jgi:hypothetical protein